MYINIHYNQQEKVQRKVEMASKTKKYCYSTTNKGMSDIVAVVKNTSLHTMQPSLIIWIIILVTVYLIS